MFGGNVVRGGILCVLLAAFALSCGETSPTQPDLPNRIVAVPAAEVFLSSPQLEPRELLIDGRATDIEWNLTGAPVLLLMKGNVGSGGEYYASVRAYWTYNPFNSDSVAFYLLVQWADMAPDRLEQPLITSVDWQDDDNHSLIDCDTSDPLRDESNWRKDTNRHEDQIEVEIYSDENGAMPADKWRWGAATTDWVTPVSPTEYPTAESNNPEEVKGATDHPTGGRVDEYYNTGGGWIYDIGVRTQEPNFIPGSNVPLFIAGKGGRDIRLNRGKPTALLIWKYIAHRLEACDSLNPIRVDDASVRQKTWNPGDYVQSYLSGMPDSSEADVIARGAWEMGKWNVEIRRLMVARGRGPTVNVKGTPQVDDVPLYTGRTYGFRLRIYNKSKTTYSESPLVPLYLKPRS